MGIVASKKSFGSRVRRDLMKRLIRKKSKLKQIKRKDTTGKFYRRWDYGMVYSTIAILMVIQLILSSTGIGELLTRATEDLPVELNHEISIKEINIFIDNGLHEPTYIVKKSQVTGNALPANSAKIQFEILWEWNEEYTEMIPAGSFLNLKLPWESIEFKKTENHVLKDGEQVYGVWGIKPSEPLHLVFDDTDPTGCNIGGTFEFVGSTGKLSGKTIPLEVGAERFTIDTTDGQAGFVPTVAVVPPSPEDPPPKEPAPKPSEDEEEPPVEPPAEPPAEPISTVIPTIFIDKTIDGIPIQQWFEENLSNDHYQSVLEYILFDVYYLGATDPDQEGSGFDANKIFEDLISRGANPIFENLKLNDGKIVFEPELAGWYAIMENPLSEINGVFAKISPLFVYVSRTGISSSIHQEDSSKKMFVYSIPYEVGMMNSKVQSEYGKYFKEGDQRRQLQVIYNDGCVEMGPNKPDGSGQQLCTEGFITVIGADGTYKGNTWGGEPFYSMCADLGAHFVSGSYTFDDLNHYFLDSDIEYLVSIFDYINRMNGTGDFLMTADGRALAQIILWNKVIERDHNEGFTDSWRHPDGCEHGGVGGIVKVLGQGSWFTEGYAAFIECALGHKEGLEGECSFCGGSWNVQEFYIQQYIANKNSGGDQSYVSNVLFVVGAGDEEKVNQQRQLVVFFDHGVTFDNHYVYNGDINIPMRKEVVSNVLKPNLREFEFTVTQVEGLTGAKKDTKVTGGATISQKVSLEGYTKATDFTIHIPDLMPDLDKDFEAMDKLYFFKITENLSGDGIDGWQYEKNTYWIEVRAREVKGESGARSVVCEITKKISSDEEEVGERIIFTNKYQVTSASLIIPGKKAVTGLDPESDHPATAGKEFTFKMVQVEGLNELILSEEQLARVKLGSSNDKNGEFEFEITGLEEKNSPYYFMITEDLTDDGKEGWTYSKTIYWVQVDVTLNREGAQRATYTLYTYDKDKGKIVLIPETEGLKITFTNTYTTTDPEDLIISAEVYKDTIRRTSAAYVSLPNKEGFNNVGNEEEHYRYDVHFRSTSNVAADEFVVDDPLENVGMGHVRIEGLWTPVVWGSTDGLFNVWFKTNKTNDKFTYSTATVRRNTHLTAAYPNTGYKLWARNLSTDKQYYLDVSRLNLAEGEYITAIRYEYGGVEVGFTSMNTYRDSWNGEHRTQSKAPINLPSKNKDKIAPLNPQDIVPKVANPNPIVSVIGVTDQLFAPAYGVQRIALEANASEGMGEDVVAFTSTHWNSIDGDRVDWTPHPQSPFYPSNPEAAASLEGAKLKPASYLVSATASMNSAEIVSSATARIAKHHNGIYLRDHDQDAVVTKVITTFDTGAKGYQPDDYKIESSFVDNAIREGFDLRTIGGRKALIREIEGPVPRTGDASLTIILVMAITSFVSLIVVALLFGTRRRESKEMGGKMNPSGRTKRNKQKAKTLRKRMKGLLLLLLLLAIVAPMGKAYAGEVTPKADGEEESSENITIEYRYVEGQEGGLVIRDTITQFGRVYRLIDTSEPVLEKTLPRTRTYTFKIDGSLSKEDLALIDGLEDMIHLTPVEEVFEREVDKIIVIRGLPTNEVEYLAETREFQVVAAKEPSLQTTKALARAGVSFEVEAYEDTGLERLLPSSYKATIVYRGTETYTEVIYYLAELTYQKTETIGEIKQYMVKATYAPTGEEAGIDDLIPEIIEEEERIPDDIVKVIIEDPEEVPEATPLEQTLEELKDAGVPLAQIGDEEVPLYGFPGMPVWALANLIMVILAAILTAITIIRMLIRKVKDRDKVPLTIRGADTKENNDESIPRESARTYRITWFILVMVGTIGMGMLFVITQNINDLMVIFDIWSIAFGAIMTAEVIGTVLSFKRIKEPLRTFVR